MKKFYRAGFLYVKKDNFVFIGPRMGSDAQFLWSKWIYGLKLETFLFVVISKFIYDHQILARK